MKKIQSQKGVGLVEILVALLILAVGVLGFIALQYRALEATSEAGARIQAMMLARDLAERIRVNRDVFPTYQTELQNSTAQKISSVNCKTMNCSQEELADYDVAQISERATSLGMSMNIMRCQNNTNTLNCIYVAWGDSAPTNGDGVGDCTSGVSYNPISTCLIMETY